MKRVLYLTLLLVLSSCDQSQDKSAPEISPPEINTPEITQPKINPPEITPPEINTPKINPPEITAPDITAPEITAPEITAPEITAPEIKVRQNDNKTIYNLPSDILFDFDKSDIRPSAEEALTQISASIAQRGAPNAQIKISGHTDAVGNDDYNLALSDRRAEAVAQWLVENVNIDASRLTTQGVGEAQPIAANTQPDGSDNPAGRQQNRRVEIIVPRN